MYLAEVKNVLLLLLLILRAVLHSCFNEPPVGDVIVVGAWRSDCCDCFKISRLTVQLLGAAPPAIVVIPF